MRILYCGGVVPMREWHSASPLLWRHFAALSDDFELRCILPAMAKNSGVNRDLSCSFVSPDPWWLKYRRFSPAAFRVLTSWRLRQLEKEGDKLIGLFRPKVILGVWIPDDLLWLSRRLQQRLQVPRALFLHDVHSTKHFGRAAALVTARLLADLKNTNLGLAVSRSMEEFAREHGCPDVKLLYPVPETSPLPPPPKRGGDKLSIVYFGSLHRGYAPPMEALARSLPVEKWDLAVTWLGEKVVRPQIERIRQVRDLGWFKIDGLPALAAETDVFVVLQSFEENDRLTTSVNFQSKFTQIAQFAKPVLVIAPPWSSIARWAKEKQATLGRPVVELVEDCSDESMKAALARLENSGYRVELGAALREVFAADFEAVHLQSVFEQALSDTIPTAVV